MRIQALKEPPEPIASDDSVSARNVSERNIEDYYRSMFDSGLEYSPEFQTIRDLRAGTEATGQSECHGPTYLAEEAQSLPNYKQA